MGVDRKSWWIWVFLVLSMTGLASIAWAQSTQEQVIDLPTRPGVTQRLLLITPSAPKTTVVLFAGGHGGLQLDTQAGMAWGAGNFLVRTRQLFAQQALQVVLIDAPSDRMSSGFLSGFRQTPEHVQDVQAVMAWLRAHSDVPIWLIGTSRGTQSVAYLATELTGRAAPDGIVLTSTIVRDQVGRAVTAMPLEKLRLPVLAVHHENDGCKHCLYQDVGPMMDKLTQVPRKQLISMAGGSSRGDPCEAFAHHGFNGLESEVVVRIATWILSASKTQGHGSR